MLVHRLKKRNFIDFFFLYIHNSPSCSVLAAVVIEAESYDDTIPTITGK